MPKFRILEKKKANTAKRVFLVGAFFACSFGLLASRAVFFHLKNNDDLEKVALRQYRTAVHQSTKRGKILDSAGRELAIDIVAESIYANPREIDEPVVMAEKLSKMLKVDRRRLLERLTTGRKFGWIKRRATEDEVKNVMSKEIKGIYSMRENSRSYPGKMLAATIIGAVGIDAQPLGGVELAYNDLLSASVQKGGDVRRDARGFLYLSPTDEGGEAKTSSVFLTIDRTLQYITEKELNNAVLKSNAKGGAAIVVDVNTGAILAVANAPSFDPNEYERYDTSSWRNRSIVDAYEPGSTFKTIVVASALDAGVVTENDVMDCENGNIKIGSKVVHDAHPHGKLSVADIVKVSSNIGAYKVGQKLGMKNTYEAIRSFGFGSPTGIDLPGEERGIFSDYKRWSDIQFATIAFGQGIAATPLQMSMAFAAIANGGTLLRPYIVKKIVSDNGQEVYVGKKEEVGRPINVKAARLMGELLERVTLKGGTGTMAASKEYRVAGKTGTAQKAGAKGQGYSKGKYYSSFIGFAPVDNPKIAVYVGIDEPTGGMYYGGQVAAPAFKEIVDATLHYLKVPGRPPAMLVDKDDQNDDKVSTAELAEVISADLSNQKFVQNEDSSWVMPDLKGLTMRGVLKIGEETDVNWKFSGSGIAFSQTPEAGSKVYAGAQCEVEFKSLM